MFKNKNKTTTPFGKLLTTSIAFNGAQFIYIISFFRKGNESLQEKYHLVTLMSHFTKGLKKLLEKNFKIIWKIITFITITNMAPEQHNADIAAISAKQHQHCLQMIPLT